MFILDFVKKDFIANHLLRTNENITYQIYLSFSFYQIIITEKKLFFVKF